mmetsp:Transcript_26433/g.88895  ORF Transcript_26433/g.88895 Transcript_26433/m.88895 type:complete len:291 (+) Transcript_26433:3077-3949(+)
MKTASSVAATSTMINRSTQNNSTCSRDQGEKAPPSCSVRAPSATAPSCFSEDRPPAAVMRRWPRCASDGSGRTLTRSPLPATAENTPVACERSADFHTGFRSATSSATWSGVTSAFGTKSSGSGSSGSEAASEATLNSLALSMTTGVVRSLSIVGAQATMAEGRAVEPKSMTCAHKSRATAFASSRVIVSKACSVAACAVSGEMKVCAQAKVSIKWVSCSPWASWSPIVASCSESVAKASPKRSSSDGVRPKSPRRLVSRTAALTASSHLEASAVISKETTAHASRAESK